MENKYIEEIEVTEALANVEDFDTVETEEEKSGISTLAAMAIGAGVTAATFGVVKLVKKGIRKLKAKKAMSKVNAEETENDVFEAEYEDISED